jgi:hypothetical protein
MEDVGPHLSGGSIRSALDWKAKGKCLKVTERFVGGPSAITLVHYRGRAHENVAELHLRVGTAQQIQRELSTGRTPGR